jgi:hypothetical protein
MPDAWRMGGNNTYYNNYTYYNVTGSDNSTWFLSGTWLLNNRSIATSGVNVTGVILASQNVSTPLLNASCITLSGEQVCNWSAVNGSSGGGGEVFNGTFNETEGVFVYNSTPFLINFNDTLLNLTIDSRSIDVELDPHWTGNESTVARTGDCPSGQFVQNTTTGGVECAVASGSVAGGDNESVQFNYNGGFGGSPAFKWYDLLHQLVLSGNIVTSGNITSPVNASWGYFNNGTCIVIGNLYYVSEC